MSTLLTALFYLWLVLTVLLVIMWFIRDRGHGPDSQPEPNDRYHKEDSDGPDEPDKADELDDSDSDVSESLGLQPQPTIDDLLDGVALPFDLAPIPARVEDPDSHVVFLSPHDDAEEVGTAFADELVRVGYDIEPAGFDEALAKRNGDMLSLRISPRAAEVRTGGVSRYPSANPNDIAIEVWTGQGPPPRLAD